MNGNPVSYIDPYGLSALDSDYQGTGQNKLPNGLSREQIARLKEITDNAAMGSVSGVGWGMGAEGAVAKIATKIHGNSLKTLKPTDVYAFRELGSGIVLRFGETTQVWKVRGQQWARKIYKDYGIQTYVEPIKEGVVKPVARDIETAYIKTYEKIFGNKPPLNKSYH